MGKITSKCKGGVVEHIDTGSYVLSWSFDIPIKDISHLINEPQNLHLLKWIKLRKRVCI